MRKKIILLSISILLLTGCSVEYNLNINEDNFSENVKLIGESNEDNQEISSYAFPIPSFVNSPVESESTEKLPDVKYYDINKYTDNNSAIMELKNQFTYNEYKKSTLINKSFSSIRISKVGGKYSLYTGAYIKAFDTYNINNLTIKINLSDIFEIVESNADSTNGNTLIWNISKDQYKANPLSLVFKNKDDSQEPSSNSPSESNPNKTNKNSYALYIFSGILIVAILLGYYFFIKLKNKNNGIDD